MIGCNLLGQHSADAIRVKLMRSGMCETTEKYVLTLIRIPVMSLLGHLLFQIAAY